MMEMFAAGEDAAEQNRGVDGRDLGIPHALAGVDVGEVIEKSAMIGKLLREEVESGDHAFDGIAAGNEAALVGDSDCGKAKAGGRDAGYNSLIVDADVATIFNEAGLVAGLFPKKEEAGIFDFVEKLIVFGR